MGRGNADRTPLRSVVGPPSSEGRQRIHLLIDTSGSMNGPTERNIEEGLNVFLDRLAEEPLPITVSAHAFDDRPPRELIAETRAELRPALPPLHVNGGSALARALTWCADHLAPGLLVVVTDEEADDQHSMAEAVARILASPGWAVAVLALAEVERSRNIVGVPEGF